MPSLSLLVPGPGYLIIPVVIKFNLIELDPVSSCCFQLSPVTFQPLNILLFPISIASDFITISWNISQSFNKDLVLQVQELDRDLLYTGEEKTQIHLSVFRSKGHVE